MSLGNSLLLGVYSGLWRIAKPVLRRSGRLREGFAQRLAPGGWPAEPAARQGASSLAPPLRIWIQAASGGEAWLAHSLVPALARACAAHGRLTGRPLSFLCTTCTRQGMDVLEKLAEENLQDGPPAPLSGDTPFGEEPFGCASMSGGSEPRPLILPRYFPLDDPKLMRKALRQARPDLIALLETELWPGFLAAAKEQRVPVLVLNGRMTGKSFSFYRYMVSFWREHAPRRILAVSDNDAERFRRLFALSERVGVMPNMKFDKAVRDLAAVQDRFSGQRESGRGADIPCPRGRAGIPEDSLLAVLASVREQEEDMLLPVIRKLHGRPVAGRPVVVAVAPRHPHRTAIWKEKLAAAGFAVAARSEHAPGEETGVAPVRLWDTFGELQELYGMADAVFVGGSLAPLGGQNFLEPLAEGLTPLVGPHLDNFAWVGEEIFSRKLVKKVENADVLAERMGEELELRLTRLDAYIDGQMAARSAAGENAAFRSARRKIAEDVRERFSVWLAAQAGGALQAARIVAEELATT